jgi:hypothetical protein
MTIPLNNPAPVASEESVDISALVGSATRDIRASMRQDAPKAPEAPKAPKVPEAPKAPKAPEAPKADVLGKSSIPPELLGDEPAKKEVPKQEPLPAPGSKEDNLAHMRQRITEQQKIIDELNALKAQYLGDDGAFKLPENVTRTMKEREEEVTRLRTQLSRLNFAESPEFKERYQNPVDLTFQQIAGIVKEFEGPEGLAERLAGMSVRQRLDVLKTDMPDAASILLPLYATLDQQLYQRHRALENHQQEAGRLQQESMIQKQQQVDNLRSTMKSKALSTLEQQGYFMFSKVPGNDEWNGKVDKMRDAVDVLIKSDDVALQAEALAMSVAAPVYRNLYEEERAARIEAEKLLSRYRSADPSVRTPGGNGTGTQAYNPAEPMTADRAADLISNKIFQNMT